MVCITQKTYAVFSVSTKFVYKLHTHIHTYAGCSIDEIFSFQGIVRTNDGTYVKHEHRVHILLDMLHTVGFTCNVMIILAWYFLDISTGGYFINAD